MESNLFMPPNTPATPRVPQINPSHNNFLLLATIFVGIVILGTGGFLLYGKYGKTSNKTINNQVTVAETSAFTPLPFLNDCGFNDTAKSAVKPNSFVRDIYMNGYVSGIIKDIITTPVEQSFVELSNRDNSGATIKIPLSRIRTSTDNNKNIVKVNAATASGQPVTSLKKDQLVNISFTCRPKTNVTTQITPSFEVTGIIVNSAP